MFENCVRIMAREYEDDDDEPEGPDDAMLPSVSNVAQTLNARLGEEL